jgi:hypothetical protein
MLARVHRAARFVALVVPLVTACSAHRATPEEVVAALKAQGLEVRVIEGSGDAPEWAGFEVRQHLVLDAYEDYAADRFASNDIARGYCETMKSGVRYGLWCLHPLATYPVMATWTKVAALRTP